jgi:DoxX-like family
MSVISIVSLVLAWVLTAFLSLAFFKAGKFKLTAPISALLEAGFGWVSKIPAGLVRVIALLELAGVVGIIGGAAVYEISGGAQVWGQLIAIAAASGLGLTMIVATIMHQVRGESKYTFKMTSTLVLASVVLAVALALVKF